ncbi:hypothetical protein GCM10009646_69060 [Streptomyces aureus]
MAASPTSRVPRLHRRRHTSRGCGRVDDPPGFWAVDPAGASAPTGAYATKGVLPHTSGGYDPNNLSGTHVHGWDAFEVYSDTDPSTGQP